ncbi:MAG: HWE histidine kinase domain-containing protein [Planctomycetota bacterium]
MRPPVPHAWRRRLLRLGTRAFLAVAASCAVARAEDPPLLEGLFDPWRWRLFTTEDGLPGLGVRHFLEARDGTLWVGTDQGLCHFDGFEFRMAPDLPQAPTASLCEDSAGRIAVSFQSSEQLAWIGGPGGFAAVPTPHTLSAAGRVIQAWAKGADGALVGFGRGVHDTPGAFVFRSGEPDERIIEGPPSLWPDSNPLLDVCGGNGVWVRERDGLQELTESGPGPALPLPVGARAAFAVVEPARGGALVAVHFPWSQRGLWDLDASGARRVPGSEGELVQAIDATSNGEAVAVLDSAKLLWRSGAGAWSSVDRIPGPLRNVSLVHLQVNGDLWVGGVGGLRLLRLASARWSTSGAPTSGVRSTVLAFEGDGNGGVWVGLSAGLEHRPASGPSELILEALGQSLETVTALERDAAGRLWVGSGAGAFPGVLVFDGERWTHLGPAQGLDARCVHQIRRSPSGAMVVLALPDLGGPSGIWTGTVEGLERSGPFDALSDATRYYDAAWTRDGTLWIGSSLGIARVRHGETTLYQKEQGLRQLRTFALAAAPDGSLYFGNQDRQCGLGHITLEGRVESIPQSDGSSELGVLALKFDPVGRLWIGARDGLLLLEDDLLRRVDRRTQVSQSRVHAIEVSDGRLHVGTDGAGAMSMSLDAQAWPSPRVRIDSIAVDGVSAEARWRVASFMKEDTRDALIVRHRIDQGPWSPWSHRGSANFEHLAHGDHTLEVELAGMLHRARTSASFRINDPLRQVLWVAAPLASLTGLAVVFGAWSIRRRLSEAREHRATSQRFEQLANSVHEVFWLIDWQARTTLYISPAFERLFDLPIAALDAFGTSWLSRVHPDDRDEASASYKRSIEEDGVWDHEFRVVRGDGRVGWIHAKAVAILDEHGRVARVAGVGEEITQRREAEAHQLRLSLELDHRVKNNLAQVLALAEQTLRSTKDLNEFQAAFVGRIRALARTHETLAASHWQGSTMRLLARRSVESLVGVGRLRMFGDDYQMTARVSSALGLTLHELATNALKYGALSGAEGHVELHWVVDASGLLELTWLEVGAKDVRPPVRAGLGTTLIRGMIEHELGGAVELEFGAAGLRCHLTIPGTRQARDAAPLESLDPAPPGPALPRRSCVRRPTATS